MAANSLTLLPLRGGCQPLPLNLDKLVTTSTSRGWQKGCSVISKAGLEKTTQLLPCLLGYTSQSLEPLFKHPTALSLLCGKVQASSLRLLPRR